MPSDPEISELEERRARLKQGQYRIQGREDEAEIRELTDKIRTKRAHRDKRIVKEYREYYFYHRPTWDIERQARGEVEEEYADPGYRLAGTAVHLHMVRLHVGERWSYRAWVLARGSSHLNVDPLFLGPKSIKTGIPSLGRGHSFISEHRCHNLQT